MRNMSLKNVSKVAAIFLFGISVQKTAWASEAEELATIASLPIERCQKDLTKLHDIHGQLRYMNQEQALEFLQLIAAEIKSKDIKMPPPPAPCSTIHLALEQRCGDLADAKNKCSVASSN